MNNVQGINATTPQITFTAKKPNRKAIHEFIDKSSNLAMDYLNKDRPIEEKREIAMRRAIANLKIKDFFIGNIIEKGKAAIEHIKSSLGLGKTKNNAYKRYEQYIKKAVEDGVMDADHATSLLTRAKAKLK